MLGENELSHSRLLLLIRYPLSQVLVTESYIQFEVPSQQAAQGVDNIRFVIYGRRQKGHPILLLDRRGFDNAVGESACA